MGPEDWNRRYSGSELLWTAQPNRFLVAEATGLPPGRALDLACGEGRNAVWLAAQGWRVTGVDFSEMAISKARSQGPRCLSMITLLPSPIRVARGVRVWPCPWSTSAA